MNQTKEKHDQHTDNGWRRKLWYNMADGRMGHFIILVMFFFCLIHENAPYL